MNRVETLNTESLDKADGDMRHSLYEPFEFKYLEVSEDHPNHVHNSSYIGKSPNFILRGKIALDYASQLQEGRRGSSVLTSRVATVKPPLSNTEDNRVSDSFRPRTGISLLARQSQFYKSSEEKKTILIPISQVWLLCD